MRRSRVSGEAKPMVDYHHGEHSVSVLGLVHDQQEKGVSKLVSQAIKPESQCGIYLFASHCVHSACEFSVDVGCKFCA